MRSPTAPGTASPSTRASVSPGATAAASPHVTASASPSGAATASPSTRGTRGARGRAGATASPSGGGETTSSSGPEDLHREPQAVQAKERNRRDTAKRDEAPEARLARHHRALKSKNSEPSCSRWDELRAGQSGPPSPYAAQLSPPVVSRWVGS